MLLSKIRILTVFFMALSISISANDFGISDSYAEKMNERVSLMNYEQLVSQKSLLIDEKNNLEMVGSNTQNPSENKRILLRLKEINAELSSIQKALVVLVGASAASALFGDDGYNDNIPPVITIIGDNPATAELGTTYIDAGA